MSNFVVNELSEIPKILEENLREGVVVEIDIVDEEDAGDGKEEGN